MRRRLMKGLSGSILLGMTFSAGASAAAVVRVPNYYQQDTTKAKKKTSADAGKTKGAENGDKDKKGKNGKEASGADTLRTPAEDSARAVKRVEKARNRPLFLKQEPLPFTLTANFGQISRDRDSTSTKRFDGMLTVRDDSGTERSIPVKLRTRGHYRLQSRNCRFVNLQVFFPDKGTKGTPFDGQASLKLGGHCQNDDRFEQYLLKEYLAYRVFNQVTDVSFRARLSKGTYVDSASGKAMETRAAMWIENEDDMAARVGGHVRDLRRALFADVDGETLDQMTLFEYAIGNTDWSIYALHNTRLVRRDNGFILPVPYDFDFSGLVDASYAAPDPQLRIGSVRIRLFRGPCRLRDEIEPRLAVWRERREAILGQVDQVVGLGPREARTAREFLTEFFERINDPRAVKRELIDGCLSKPGA